MTGRLYRHFNPGGKMNERELSQKRGEIIEEAINVEWLMNTIIAQHYFKRIVKPFILEVLYDEYFSFGLKRRILEKVIDNPDSSKIQDLNRINTIRNYFAHCNQEIFVGSDPMQAEGKILDPRRLDREIDFEKLYKEFKRLIPGVHKYLATVYSNKGGKLYSIENGQFVEKNLSNLK
jgi:hypothetical protein